MKYCDLYKDFISIYPEDKEYFNTKCKETLADEEDGMHIMFGMVVVPYIIKCLTENLDKVKLAFEFIERMEKSDDKMIAEVAEVSILEELITDNKSILDKVKEYAGPETLLAIEEMEKWYK